MVPVLLIGLAIGAAIVSIGTAVFIPAVVNAVASFWSNGVAANFTREDMDEMPNWAANVAMLTGVLSVVFLVLGLLLD